MDCELYHSHWNHGEEDMVINGRSHLINMFHIYDKFCSILHKSASGLECFTDLFCPLYPIPRRRIELLKFLILQFKILTYLWWPKAKLIPASLKYALSEPVQVSNENKRIQLEELKKFELQYQCHEIQMVECR